MCAGLGVIARESADAGISAMGARQLREAGREMAEGAVAVGDEVATSVRARARTAPGAGVVTAAGGGGGSEMARDAAISLAPFLGTAAGVSQTVGACGAIGR